MLLMKDCIQCNHALPERTRRSREKLHQSSFKSCSCSNHRNNYHHRRRGRLLCAEPAKGRDNHDSSRIFDNDDDKLLGHNFPHWVADHYNGARNHLNVIYSCYYNE